MRGQWGRLLLLIARDGAILAGTLTLWHPPSQDLAPAVFAAFCATLIGYLAHEWGHLLGCLVTGARFELPSHPFQSPFLFRFNRVANSRRQFFSMALGGFTASIATVGVLMAILPSGLLATRLTLGLVGLGVAATLLIEVPEFVRVWRGAPLPDGAAFVSKSSSP